MFTVRTKWNRLSVRYKVLFMVSCVCVFTMVLMSFYFNVQDNLMNEFARLMDDNVTCYEFQEAIKSERDAFITCVRENSRENQACYRDACEATRAALDALPFDYSQVGAERYARTWRIRSGYEGYAAYRDAVIGADPAEPGDMEDFYRVQDMQDDLSDYALSLVQLTLEEGNEVYSARDRLFRLVPVFYLLLALTAAAMILGLLWLISRHVMRPMLRMADQTRHFEQGDFSDRDIPVESGEEIGRLVTAFNHMKHALREHISTLEEKNRMAEALHRQELTRMELEKHLDRTRLEMLKSQVNPHFLFNTLHMISSMAKLEDAGTTDQMILSLSSLFRYNLRTREQEVSLAQELDALDDYIYIQQMRFDSRITYRKIIRADADRVCIPSFTLQPVVENAIVHGLSSVEAGGRITLRIWEKEDAVWVSIADNGKGMTARELEELKGKLRSAEQTSLGIGLGNICRRVEMMYPDGAYHIYSKPDRGTVIQFVIPQKKEEI